MNVMRQTACLVDDPITDRYLHFKMQTECGLSQFSIVITIYNLCLCLNHPVICFDVSYLFKYLSFIFYILSLAQSVMFTNS